MTTSLLQGLSSPLYSTHPHFQQSQDSPERLQMEGFLAALSAKELWEGEKKLKSKKVERFIYVIKSDSQMKSAGDV